MGDKPAEEEKYKGTGLIAKRNATLERTGSHELRHSADNKHPDKDTMPGSLMHQSDKAEADTKITREQIMDMLKKYEEGKLNNGRQNY